MVEKSTFTQPKFIDDGSVDWQPVKNAFTEIQEILNEHADEMKALARHNTVTISYAIEGGSKTILNAGKHQRAIIRNAYVVMGDNVPEGTTIELVGISDVIKFSDTEKTGKVRIFKLLKNTLHFIDEVRVHQSGDRRMVINLTLESTEED